mgnify:CR=1 FL=1
MRFTVPGEVVGDGNGSQNAFGTDDLAQLIPFSGPMQAGCDQDQDVLPPDARGEDLLDERRQQSGMGDRAGDVTDQDAGRFAFPGQLSKRWA